MSSTHDTHEDHSHSHEGHEHHSHAGHDHGSMVEEFKKRFFVSLIVTLPILILSPMIQNFIGLDISFQYDQYVLFGLATFVFFYGGWPFLTGAIGELKQKNPGMMTLIGLAVVVAYVYSSLVVFGWAGRNFFWELATLIDIMLLGHWIEMKSVMGASNALQELVKLMPNEAHRLKENGETEDVPLNELHSEDLVVVKPGEKIPVDGLITDGKSAIDESMLTGESVPVEKETDDEVIGGSMNKEGSLTVQVKKTGDDTYLSQVIKLVQEAQNSKSRAQDFANRAAKWLFYLALGAGITTFIIWMALGYSFDIALERMVTVMVITCPHALGLAAPLVVAVSTSLSAKQGLLIRNRTQFENARNIDAVIFDKTGTLTKGEFGVTDIIPNELEENVVLYWAASVEQNSEHPLARGILEKAREQKISLGKVEGFESITGKGLKGLVDEKEVKVMSPGYMEDEGYSYDKDSFNGLSGQGKTVVFVLLDDQFIGMIALADMVRDSAKEAIAELKANQIHSVMLTGDNRKVADWVAAQLGIDEVYAEVLPDHKADKVKEVQSQGKKVAMTGDGINDAPALATADVGIAIGSGTDVAVETADIVLVKSNPKDIVSIIRLSKNTYKKMVQNLWWAAGYNIFAIPLAAGILAPLGFLLSPAVGAVLMSLSTVVVAVNAKLLKTE
ncbi:copper-translocating P-type ATPase [Halobacillus kuroshimensis]|uniref:P-type Cu(+) transporter n=1 Tax=Halobacillus kuroshimensis TaxID=302481 RepID=A0ABS3DW48_9BACI|nr:heavy metal translocating P-type ATPase [Halobacillus kuroshimensis]MBN8235548.1 copper-translocating P-type ATPase [Halobacillus kuroshimensis]